MDKKFNLARPALVAGLFLLTGCATAPQKPIGAVVPLEGGKYQSAIKAPDQSQALKVFTHDAELTCTKGEPPRNPFAAKPPAGKYIVLSQTAKDKDGKQIKADNKTVEAGIAVGLRYLGLESKDAVEINTVFRCE